MKKQILLSLCLHILSCGAFAQETKTDKKKLRELSPDRPHQTESPITVDPGHVMLETDLVNSTSYKQTDPHSTTKGLFYFNFKYGFHKNMDIEVLSNAYSFTKYENHALPSSSAPFPDFTFRYKLNILGNDSGKTAIAIMPFITTTNMFHEKWQAKTGGLLVNAEHMFGRCELGYTGGLSSFTLSPFFSSYQLFSTVSFSYPVYKTLNNFIEVSERFNSSGDVRNNYSIDSGFTFTPTTNNQFDCGFYYFIPVKMFYVFIGTTIRI